MNTLDKKTEPDAEIAAISAVYSTLKDLPADARCRVMAYVVSKLAITLPEIGGGNAQENQDRVDGERDDNAEKQGGATEELEGISPVAKKWMVRNGLTTLQLSKIFSLGIEEIDLVAKLVPGKNKTDRMRSVFLLKGIAAYLGGGASRFTHKEMKEACLHYNAFDATNFAVHLKSLASEVSGDKATGYSLTPRGMTNATEMVKSMVSDATSG